MEISQQNIDELNAVLTLKLSKEDYFDKYESALKQYRKQVNMPGFRAGHVPLGLVKKQYGKSILADEINKVINESLNSHIVDNKLKVLGNPLPKATETVEGDWDNPDAFTFEYEIGLSPEVEIKLPKKAMEMAVVDVDDKLIDQQVEDMARRFGKMSTPESSADKDMIMATLVQLDDKDEILEGGIMKDVTISLEFLEDKKTIKDLTGLKSGMTRVVNPHHISRGHDDLGRMLDINHDEVHDLKGNFKLTVNDVKRMTPAEINEELFNKVFGEGNVKTETEFRERIKADLDKMFRNDAERFFKKQLADKLIEDLNPPLPDDFLKRWIAAANEKPLTPEQIEAEYPSYAESLKWQLIQNRVIEENELDVKPEEVVQHVKEMITQQYAQYGMPLDEEQLNTMAANAMTNREESQRVAEMIYENKVVDTLKEKTKIKEKAFSYDDFLKLVQSASN